MYEGQQTKAFIGGNAAGMALGTSAMNMAAQEGVRQLELPASCDRLATAACFAEESLNELVMRLDGVLRPAVPSTGEGKGQLQAAPPASSYAARIYDETNRVGRLGERIQELLRRLEV